MAADPEDIEHSMGANGKRTGVSGSTPAMVDSAGHAVVPDVEKAGLEPGEFSERFEGVKGTLWLIAAGMLGGGRAREDADDVVQEAAIVGLSKLMEYETSSGDGGFTAWMGQIVRNIARNHIRKQHRRRTVAIDPATMDRAGGKVEVSGSGEQDGDVLKALDELDETPRTCLLLRIVREMSYRDIATVLDIPEGTAMSHVHRARKTLRSRLASADRDGRRT